MRQVGLVAESPGTLADQRFASRQKFRLIHCEHMNRRPTDCRQSGDNSAIEPKVFAPVIPTRVKEPNDISGFSVAARDIGTLVAITVKTTKSQIVAF